MNIDEIQTFLAIAELGGFTQAGHRLHRSQPAISRRLALLEGELGAPMFERIRGGVRLTEAGRAFLPHAEAAVAALKDGSEAEKEHAAGALWHLAHDSGIKIVLRELGEVVFVCALSSVFSFNYLCRPSMMLR